ncbi:MAG: endonuclease/exonuclease/phosphatase family protein [Candidatus Marinimicrobia bacterium]|nr:endonuclease/exonuclease/phosphatase family protein [Candidatus Neomarinimicrobiota bacterium]
MKFKIPFIILFTWAVSSPIKINLVTTNDIHGVIASQKATFMNPQYPPTIVGAAAFSKYVDELRTSSDEDGEGLLILDGGNIFQGNPLGMADSGQTMIEWMNRVGYNAMVPGSYDFISDAENLRELALSANFPFLFSNLACDNCPLELDKIKPYIIKELNGVKVGILGVVNSQLSEIVLAENLQGSTAKFEVPTMREWVPIMKSEGAEIIIVLTSSGVPWNREDEYEKFVEKVQNGEVNENETSLNALEMAYFAEDVDFIVAGGNSKGYWLPWYDPNSHTYVIQGYGNGTEFSHIKLLVDEHTHLFMGYETLVDGRASQTLLSDDFEANRTDVNWIQSKLDEAIQSYSENRSVEVKHTTQPQNLQYDQWDFPNFNKEESIEIITWNCEFFPHANDSTILALAEAVSDMDVDIIAFQELRRVGWFSKLMDYLPQYSYIVSEQASFMDLAIIFKSDMFEFEGQFEPFSDNDYNFAGRPPLQADLLLKAENGGIPLSIINIHMKCCDSGLQRRKNAVQMLHEYVDENFESQSNIILLGDWNDDTKDEPGQHSFDAFFDDDRFHFVTQEISYDISQASYPKEPWVSFLDHILVSNVLVERGSNYHVQTIKMGDYMGGYKNYDTYISDHLPVLLSFPKP